MAPEVQSAARVTVARSLAAIVVTVAVLDFVGWAAGIEVLTRLAPNWPQMTPWTATWLSALSASVLLQSGLGERRWPVFVAQALSSVVAVIALVVLVEYVTNSAWAIDLWLFHDEVLELQASFPGRPSPQTSVATLFVAVVIGLIRLDARAVRGVWLVTSCVGLFLPMLAVGAYLFQAVAIRSIAVSTGMALTTALGLVMVAAAATLLRPDRPPVSWIAAAEHPLAVTRMISIVLGMPLVLWLGQVVLEDLGLSSAVALVLAMAAATILVAGAVYVTGAQVDRAVALSAQAADDLAVANTRYRLLAENSADVVAQLDGPVIAWISPSVTTSLGGSRADWVGVSILDLVPPEDIESVHRALSRVSEGETVEVRLPVITPAGDFHWTAVRARQLPHEDGNPSDAVASIRVVDDQVAAEEALVWQARRDALTGLANRRTALDEVAAVTAQPRHPGSDVGVLFCDVDKFKDINDRHGHAAGDQVLVALAERLSACVRKQDTVARVGGDELLVILVGLHGVDEARQIAEKIRHSAMQPIALRDTGDQVTTSLSIGVTLARTDEAVDDLVERADRAMYQAKSAGANQVVLI